MTTTATEWLNNHPGDLEILDKMLLDSGMSANIVTQYPEWMKKDVAKQLTESFSQPYWKEISETTLGDAEKYIRQGLNEGWSIRRMADSMSGSFAGSTAKYAKMRSKRIARTESGNALNGARKASMNHAKEELPNEVSDFMRPLWHSVLGDTTRDSHAFIDGVPADEEGMWTLAGVRIPWPAHYTLPVGERVNCQCTIIQSYGMQPDEAKKLIAEGEAREIEAAKPKPKPLFAPKPGLSEETKRALEALDKLPVGADGYLDSGHVFRDTYGESPYEDPMIMSDDDLKRKIVKLDRLDATQSVLEPSQIRYYIENPDVDATIGAKKPLLVKAGGTHYVDDGHHRVAAWKLLGRTEGTFDVYAGTMRREEINPLPKPKLKPKPKPKPNR